MIMERRISAHKRRFPCLVLALFFCAVTLAEAREGHQIPGFLYARNRGRCTPQYWSSRRESWPKMVPQTSTVSNVFSSLAYERYRYDLTLLEAASRNDDGDSVFAALLKQSTAALLNSYARKGYPYAAWEVKTLLIQALVSEDAAALQARNFMQANQDCG
ncbi:uncharacterized protein [Henckelia pumila]|uniref:uncharacterized protein n=1 Tax=Henckelia pumila TaxID=405737 RepID=UPI003C6E9E3B